MSESVSSLADMYTEERLNRLRFDERGLLPVVLQDAQSGQVLTLAYANLEAVRRTVATGQTWLYSRSRQELWHKGATSGHTQEVISLHEDCDGDALVMVVNPTGPACHTGATSCFDAAPAFADPLHTVFTTLEKRIAERERERPDGAYTTYLFEKGLDKILKKVGEETAEVIIAAKNRDPQELRYEAADLLYHLCVLLREQQLPLADVMAELNRRYQSESWKSKQE